MMKTVGDELVIDKVTVIDKELASGGNNVAVKAAVANEQIKQMLGVDLAGVVNSLGNRSGNGA